MVVRCQDNGGGGVSIAGNPGAVHGKESQHQHEEEVDHGASVEEVLHPTSWLLRRLLLLLGRSGLWVRRAGPLSAEGLLDREGQSPQCVQRVDTPITMLST